MRIISESIQLEMELLKLLKEANLSRVDKIKILEGMKWNVFLGATDDIGGEGWGT